MDRSLFDGLLVWRGEVRGLGREERHVCYMKKKTKKKQTKPKKTIVGRLSGLLAHFIMPLA